MPEQLSGTDLIAAERKRQIDEEGYGPRRDDQHGGDQLARAAACYAMPEPVFVKREGKDGVTFRTPWPRYWVSNPAGRGEGWVPWKKPEADRVTQLVRAGALIAAEIDRLQRLDSIREGENNAPH